MPPSPCCRDTGRSSAAAVPTDQTAARAGADIKSRGPLLPTLAHSHGRIHGREKRHGRFENFEFMEHFRNTVGMARGSDHQAGAGARNEVEEEEEDKH